MLPQNKSQQMKHAQIARKLAPITPIQKLRDNYMRQKVASLTPSTPRLNKHQKFKLIGSKIKDYTQLTRPCGDKGDHFGGVLYVTYVSY